MSSVLAGWLSSFASGALGMIRWPEKLPEPLAVQAQEPKTRVVPSGMVLALLDWPSNSLVNSPTPLPGVPAVGV